MLADSAVTEFCNKMSLQVRIASKSITRNTSRDRGESDKKNEAEMLDSCKRNEFEK